MKSKVKKVKSGELSAIRMAITSILNSDALRASSEVKDVYLFVYELDKCLMDVKECEDKYTEGRKKIGILSAQKDEQERPLCDVSPDGQTLYRLKPELIEKVMEEIKELDAVVVETRIPVLSKELITACFRVCKLNSASIRCMIEYFNEKESTTPLKQADQQAQQD